MDQDMVAITRRVRFKGPATKVIWVLVWGGRLMLVGGIAGLLLWWSVRQVLHGLDAGAQVVSGLISLLAILILGWCLRSGVELARFLGSSRLQS